MSLTFDREPQIRVPHAVTKTREAGRTKTRIDDPRASVTIYAEGAEVVLFFDSETALTGEAPLLEVRILPPDHGNFAPSRLMPELPLHLAYARASLNLAGETRPEDMFKALRALSVANRPRRGLSNYFLRVIADTYNALVAEGEPYPVTAIGQGRGVDKSTASRWVSAARSRGFLQTDKEN